MNSKSGRRNFYLGVLGVCTALLVSGSAHAQFRYRLDDGTAEERFNNSATDQDTQDNWVANSYQVVEDATHLVSISLPIGQSYVDQPITALIYTGSDLQNPQAGGGLALLSQTDTTFTANVGTVVTIPLDTPVDLNVGDIFYAAVLIRSVPPDQFPFFNDRDNPLGRSFFDTGTTFGGPYDINQGSDNITVLGGTHPVVGDEIQTAGNLFLWVDATPP